MTEQEILDRLIPIFQDVFDDDTLAPTPQTTPEEVASWDSLSNIRLFMAVEKAFGVRFDAGEIGVIQNVGQFVRAIRDKGAS